jgi:DNA polymerase I-like protein with 3'-5' exonuclease and polymerase domains
METSVVDFETDKIESRPNYPPKPVGVAIRWPSGDKEYLAWGHPQGNNCDLATGRMKIKEAYECDRTLFHHAAFDMDVSECYFGLKPRRFGDTLFLAFLKDPYAADLGLKPLSVKDLGMPADEQEELRDWILENVKEAKRAKTKWGEHISKAPGQLVGRYAISDVDRTHKLYRKYIPEIRERGMLEAYKRELKCAPITMEMERNGVRVDRKGLKKCLIKFNEMDHDVMRAIAKKLRIDPKNLKDDDNKKGFNINSGDQLGEALLKAGKLDAVIKTETGKV